MQSLVPVLHHLPLHTTATLLIVITIPTIPTIPTERAPTARTTHIAMNPLTTTPLPQYIAMDTTTSTAIDMADINI